MNTSDLTPDQNASNSPSNFPNQTLLSLALPTSTVLCKHWCRKLISTQNSLSLQADVNSTQSTTGNQAQQCQLFSLSDPPDAKNESKWFPAWLECPNITNLTLFPSRAAAGINETDEPPPQAVITRTACYISSGIEAWSLGVVFSSVFLVAVAACVAIFFFFKSYWTEKARRGDLEYLKPVKRNKVSSKKPRVFISYCHEGNEVFRGWIVERLKAKFNVRIDVEINLPGDNHFSNEESEIKLADKVLVCFDKNYIRSPSCKKEMEILVKNGFVSKVIPVQLEKMMPNVEESSLLYQLTSSNERIWCRMFDWHNWIAEFEKLELKLVQ